jgi:type IX secretion system PorP/SprF family membrane protein
MEGIIMENPSAMSEILCCFTNWFPTLSTTVKKMRKFAYILIIFILSGLKYSYGQDPLFTQFYAAPVYLSPSLAGSAGGSRIILNLRDQWPRLPGNYVTYDLSFDHYLEKFRSGIGLLLFRDEAAGGLINTTNIGFNYNYNFNISRKWKLIPGIQVYYYTKNIDYNKLVFSDQISRDYTTPVSIEMDRLSSLKPIRHLDITSSMLAYSDQFWAGFTLDHMLSLNGTLKAEGGYLPIRLSVYGGGKYFISGRMRSQKEESLTAAFNFMAQDKYKYLDLGAYYTRSPMQFGLWYRGIPVFSDNPNVGAITLQFGYKINYVTLGYSYDYTLSRLMTKTGGAHEVSFAYAFKSDSRKRKMRMIPCPTVF